MSPRSSNGSEDASSGAPRSAVPVSHLCTCQAKLVGEAGDCHCRVAPQIVRFSRRGLETKDRAIVGVNAHSGDPHYTPTAGESAPIRPGDWVLNDLWARLSAAEDRLETLRADAIIAASSSPDKLAGLSESTSRVEFEIGAMRAAIGQIEHEVAEAEELARREADKEQRQETSRELHKLADALEKAVAPVPDALKTHRRCPANHRPEWASRVVGQPWRGNSCRRRAVCLRIARQGGSDLARIGTGKAAGIFDFRAETSACMGSLGRLRSWLIIMTRWAKVNRLRRVTECGRVPSQRQSLFISIRLILGTLARLPARISYGS